MTFPGNTPSIALNAIDKCRLPVEAQAAILDNATFLSALLQNEFVELDSEVLDRLYTKKRKPSADDAVALLSRPLSDAQIKKVLLLETRTRPIQALCETNRLSEELVKVAFEQKKIAETVATTLVKHGFLEDESLDPVLRERAAVLAGPPSMLRWMDTSATKTEEAVKATLSSSSLDHPHRLRREDRPVLSRVIEAYPSSIETLVRPEISSSVLQVVCASRHLSKDLQQKVISVALAHPDQTGVEFALLALVNHPVCEKEVVESVKNSFQSASKAQDAASRRLKDWEKKPTVTVSYSEVSDPGVLSWMVKRATSFDGRQGFYTPPKPFEVAALCHNPNLSDDQRQRLGSDLESFQVRDAIGESVFNSAYLALYGRPHQTATTLEAKPAKAYAPTGTSRFGRGCVDDTDSVSSGGQLAARTLAMSWRGTSHSFVDTLSLSTSQWGLFFDLLDMMPDATLEEIAAVAETS